MNTLELIKRANAGDKQARDQVVTENLGLIWSIVRRFAGRGHELEDLFQIGSIGLIKAIDKFDTSFEVKFSTYAVPMITGEIKRFLRDDGMVKVSRSLKENGWKIKQATERLSHQYGRDATIEEIAKETELSMEDIVMAMEANVVVESIYKSVYQSDGNEIYLVDKLPAGDSGKSSFENADYEKDEVLNKLVLKQLMEGLEEMERKLITSRYFHDKTQVEVAKELGISQVQVSRMEKRILTRMRLMLLA